VSFRLYAVRIFSADWQSAIHFYRETLGLTERFSDAEMGWAEFDVGGPSLAIERVQDDDPEHQSLVGRFVGVSLEVDDIEETYLHLLGQGVEFTAAPARQPWGGVLAHFKDPDGNLLTLLGR